MTEDRTAIATTVNGRSVSSEVPYRMSLADFLRDVLGLTGTHLGCEHGVCGACTVVFDGRTVRSCLLLAVQAHGHAVETIEGATSDGRVASLQSAFLRKNALQCGFCTSGILLTVAEFLEEVPRPTREEIRDCLSGNLCRCTGYQSIVDAVEEVSLSRVDGQ